MQRKLSQLEDVINRHIKQSQHEEMWSFRSQNHLIRLSRVTIQSTEKNRRYRCESLVLFIIQLRTPGMSCGYFAQDIHVLSSLVLSIHPLHPSETSSSKRDFIHLLPLSITTPHTSHFISYSTYNHLSPPSIFFTSISTSRPLNSLILRPSDAE